MITNFRLYTLIVEDDPSFQEMLAEIAGDKRLIPLVEATATGGVRRIEQVGRNWFGEIITDGHLPDGNCEPVVRCATERNIPITVFSGTQEGEVTQEIAKKYNVRFVTKTSCSPKEIFVSKNF